MQPWKIVLTLLALSGLGAVPTALAQQDHPVVIVAFNYLPGQAGELGQATQIALPVMISQGDTVTGMNLDLPGGNHTITSDEVDQLNQPLFDSSFIGFMQSVPVTGVAQLPSGMHPFHCTLHPFMHGVLMVQ